MTPCQDYTNHLFSLLPTKITGSEILPTCQHIAKTLDFLLAETKRKGHPDILKAELESTKTEYWNAPISRAIVAFALWYLEQTIQTSNTQED
jgi:hypothetical protein